MVDSPSTGISRRALLGAFAATAVVAAPTYSGAAGFLRGGGDVRRLRMYSGRTGERMDTIYWIDGEYVAEAVREVSLFMRDWRNGQAVAMDTRTMDIMAASHRLLDVDEPFMLLSGYRSPQTNDMLRANSSGVARNSLHMRGQAADLRLDNRSVNQIARAALSCHAGGVGRYSGSGFVHMDCGDVRSWGS
jgi:uncharacterized protein YcbK (DUF882 family)